MRVCCARARRPPDIHCTFNWIARPIQCGRSETHQYSQGALPRLRHSVHCQSARVTPVFRQPRQIALQALSSTRRIASKREHLELGNTKLDGAARTDTWKMPHCESGDGVHQKNSAKEPPSTTVWNDEVTAMSPSEWIVTSSACLPSENRLG